MQRGGRCRSKPPGRGFVLGDSIGAGEAVTSDEARAVMLRVRDRQAATVPPYDWPICCRFCQWSRLLFRPPSRAANLKEALM